jgi:hypothetical protein
MIPRLDLRLVNKQLCAVRAFPEPAVVAIEEAIHDFPSNGARTLS